jgi:hypothetical protein
MEAFVIAFFIAILTFNSLIKKPDSKSEKGSEKGKDSPAQPSHDRRVGDKSESGGDKTTLSLKDLEKGVTIYISTKNPVN